MRCVMDEVFGAGNFIATFCWQKLYARKSNALVSVSHDTILCFARDSKRINFNPLPPTEDLLARYRNPDDDPRGPWQSVSFHVRTDNPDRRVEYRYDITLPSGRIVQPPAGRHWNGKRERFEQLVQQGRLWFGADGDSVPRLKMFLDMDSIGLVPDTWWNRLDVGDNNESKSEVQALFPGVRDVFQTPKPERLLERVVHIGSDPGDIVVDVFGGSGTTAAVAHKMGRRWVTAEISRSTVEAFTCPRLEMVVKGEDPGGISTRETVTPVGEPPEGVTTDAIATALRVLKKMRESGIAGDRESDHGALDRLNTSLRKAGKTESTTETLWNGGGGFRTVEVGPSMYEATPLGVMLADWATNGRFARAVAGQLGFEWQEPLRGSVLCGRRGRMRLAVFDGAVGIEQARQALSELDDRERVTIVAKVILPGVEDFVRAESQGSRVRKAPRDVLADRSRVRANRKAPRP